MAISKKRALGLLDESIREFRGLVATANLSNAYGDDYSTAYANAEANIEGIFSREAMLGFRMEVTMGISVHTVKGSQAYFEHYTSHLKSCLDRLKASRHKIYRIWEPDVTGVPPEEVAGSIPQLTTRVFIVHGHDEEMMQSVARILGTLDLDPIILHEQANVGRTIIEKFEHFSNVGFAVVLLSPDDMAYPRDDSPDSARPRARQNVVLELGFFIGQMGRQRVFILKRDVPNFEIPSDYAGVVYTPFDPAGAWRLSLAKELNAVGYAVDIQKLL